MTRTLEGMNGIITKKGLPEKPKRPPGQKMEVARTSHIPAPESAATVAPFRAWRGLQRIVAGGPARTTITRWKSNVDCLAEREGLLGAARLALRAAVAAARRRRSTALQAVVEPVDRNRGFESAPFAKAPCSHVFAINTVWRRGRDSNPRYGVTVHTLSRRAPSTARTPLLTLAQ